MNGTLPPVHNAEHDIKVKSRGLVAGEKTLENFKIKTTRVQLEVTKKAKKTITSQASCQKVNNINIAGTMNQKYHA